MAGLEPAIHFDARGGMDGRVGPAHGDSMKLQIWRFRRALAAEIAVSAWFLRTGLRFEVQANFPPSPWPALSRPSIFVVR
jgi:hypothetical protein